MNIREDTAKFYDIQPIPIHDVPFYEARVSLQTQVLELGCGTGRVLLPLAQRCRFIHGVDASPAMLALCREKVQRANLPPERVQLTEADITSVHLGQQFDLIIAPFRVMQNLETDAQVSGLMQRIREHLAPNGQAILNAFNPSLPPDEMRQNWCRAEEQWDSETVLPDGGKLVRSHIRPRLQSEPLVCYPELIYRRYGISGSLEEESVMKIAMRCWYPQELEQMVTANGFHITDRWGGYGGEVWGNGPELVIQFANGS